MKLVKKVMTLGFSLLILSGESFAQEIKEISKKISPYLVEHYEVNKASKKIKNGDYTVVNNKKQIIVTGKYNNNKKEGYWNYFNTAGTIIQQYDFTNNKYIFKINEKDSVILTHFDIAGNIPANSIIEPPTKIGGSSYGFFLLFDESQIPKVKNQTYRANMVINYIFHLSEEGKLLQWDISFEGEGNVTGEPLRQSIYGLPADAYEFTPALINGKGVKSTLTVSVILNFDQFSLPEGNNYFMKTTAN